MLAWRARDIVRDNEMSMERRESGAGMRISFGLRELRSSEAIRGLYGREEGDCAGQLCISCCSIISLDYNRCRIFGATRPKNGSAAL